MNGWLIGHVVAAVVVLAIFAAMGYFRPASLAGERRGVSDLPWWVWMSCGAITWLMLVVGVSIANQVWHASPTSTSTRDLAIVGLAGYGTALAGAAVLLRLVSQIAPKAGINAPPMKLLQGLVLSVALWPILQCLGFATSWLHGLTAGESAKAVAHPMLQAILNGRGDGWPWWALIVVATIAVPVVEEIIYRGFAQSLILRTTGRPWIAVFAGGLLFGAAHLGGGIPWYSVAVVAVFGLAIGFAFEKTKSLGVCIGMHVGFNAANVGLALWMG